VPPPFPLHNRDEPPFTIVDRLSERTRAIDTEVRVWHQKHPAPEIKRPSELKRGDGLQLVKKFGIAVCTRRPGVRSRSKRFPAKSTARPCGYLVIVKNGEKLPRCNGCGGRVWVKYRDVIFQHDNIHIIKSVVQNFRAWRGRHPQAMVSPVLFNMWGKRVEEKLSIRVFYHHLPWRLKLPPDPHAQGGRWCGPR